MNVFDVCESDVPAVTAFLERRPESSLFLLSNLRAFGHRRGSSLYSGNFQGIREGDAIVAVFCLARSGTLLLQTGDRTNTADAIVDIARGQGIPIRGVIGEWNAAHAVWTRLSTRGAVAETLASREVSYRLDLNQPAAPTDGPLVVRRLTVGDHDQWAPLSIAFHEEMSLPLPGDREQRRASFARSTGLGHWWGGFEGPRLVSITAIVALHKQLAQIGGVYTMPDRRRRGYNRIVMNTVIHESRVVHDLERLFLFTGETNVPARNLYESLGFERFGHFGLFFGEPR